MTCNEQSVQSILPALPESPHNRSDEFGRSKGAAASPQPTLLSCIIAVGQQHQLSMLNILSMQHHSISDEGFGLKNKAWVVESVSAGVALLVPMNLVWGQSCQCDNSPVAGVQKYVVPLSHFADPRVAGQPLGLTYKPGRQLPAGWPNQWGGPAILDEAGQVAKKEATKPAIQAGDTRTQQNADQRGKTGNDANESSQKKPETSGLISSLMVRDLFSDRMVPTTSQTRWAQGEETKAAVGVPTAGDQKKVKSRPSTETSSNVERNQSEARSGISARASKETIGGSEPSIGTSAKSRTRSWSVLPTPGRAGGGPAIGGGTGGIGGGANGGIGGGNGGGVAGNGWDWNPETGGDGAPTDGSCDDLTDIPLPDPSIPDVTPDLPTSDNPLHGGGGHNTPPGNGDSPVVPEPGSIILLGIAGGVSGAGFIRRRLKKAKAVGK